VHNNGITIGDECIQISSKWRICALECPSPCYLTVSHSSGYNPRLYQPGGTLATAHDVRWSGWFNTDGSARPLGAPNKVSIRSDMIQIGDYWRIAHLDGHLVVGHDSGNV
jgi:hypothetical protein